MLLFKCFYVEVSFPTSTFSVIMYSADKSCAQELCVTSQVMLKLSTVTKEKEKKHFPRSLSYFLVFLFPSNLKQGDYKNNSSYGGVSTTGEIAKSKKKT